MHYWRVWNHGARHYHNNQKMWTQPVSISWQVPKKLVCMCSGILLSYVQVSFAAVWRSLWWINKLDFFLLLSYLFNLKFKFLDKRQDRIYIENLLYFPPKIVIFFPVLCLFNFHEIGWSCNSLFYLRCGEEICKFLHSMSEVHKILFCFSKGGNQF